MTRKRRHPTPPRPPGRFLSGCPPTATVLRNSVGLNAKFDRMVESLLPGLPKASRTRFLRASSIKSDSGSNAHLNVYRGFGGRGRVGRPLVTRLTRPTRDMSYNLGREAGDLGASNETPQYDESALLGSPT